MSSPLWLRGPTPRLDDEIQRASRGDSGSLPRLFQAHLPAGQALLLSFIHLLPEPRMSLLGPQRPGGAMKMKKG